MLAQPTWSEDDYVVFVCCCALSGSLCACAVLQLCRRQAKTLFGMQLLALVFIDLMAAAWNGGHYVSCWTGNRTLDEFSYPEPLEPNAFRVFLDVSSCLLELQMAIGFAAACYGLQGCGFILKIMMASGFLVVALGMGLISWPAIAWSVFVIASFVLTMAVYVLAAFWATALPSVFRRRAFIRGLSYVACAFLCLIPNAFYDIPGVAVTPENHMMLFVVSHAAYLLSGAVKVCCYAFWMRSSGMNSQRHTGRLDVCDNESFMLNLYFDIGSNFDSVVFDTQRGVAEQIASLRDELADLPGRSVDSSDLFEVSLQAMVSQQQTQNENSMRQADRDAAEVKEELGQARLNAAKKSG